MSTYPSCLRPDSHGGDRRPCSQGPLGPDGSGLPPNGYEVDANRDLVGLGSASLASGLSAGITTSASAARTAVVEMVGGRSQLASVTAALEMLAVLLFVTEPLENLPTTALTAVVIGAVLRMIEVSSLRELWRTRGSTS